MHCMIYIGMYISKSIITYKEVQNITHTFIIILNELFQLLLSSKQVRV